MSPEHDPTRSERLAARMRDDAAEKAARDEALALVDRWNAAVAAGHGALWSPTLRAAILADRPWLDVAPISFSERKSVRQASYHFLGQCI